MSGGFNLLRDRLRRERRRAAFIEGALLIGLVVLTVLGLVIALGGWSSDDPHCLERMSIACLF
jgi:hypothetical protein